MGAVLTLTVKTYASYYQHHVGEVLCDQKAARLRLAQLLHHLLQRPAQGGLVQFFSYMHDGRQHPQQDAGMLAGKDEVPADHKAIPAAVERAVATNNATTERAHSGEIAEAIFHYLRLAQYKIAASTVPFPPYQLDLQNEQLWRADNLVPLRAKPFDLLRSMAENPGRLVIHEELRKAIWPATYVSEGEG